MNSVIVRAILCWFAILVVAVVSGGLREAYVRPWFGFFAAELFGAAVLSAAVIVAAFVVMRPSGATDWPAAALQVAALWLVMTLAFEFLFFHYVGGKPWSELLAAYRFWEGRLWVVVLAAIAASPFIAGRWLSAR